MGSTPIESKFKFFGLKVLYVGEMAERSIASDCKSDASRLRRFKSYSPQMDSLRKSL